MKCAYNVEGCTKTFAHSHISDLPCPWSGNLLYTNFNINLEVKNQTCASCLRTYYIKDNKTYKVKCHWCGWVGNPTDTHVGTIEEQTCYCPLCAGELGDLEGITNADYEEQTQIENELEEEPEK